MNKRSGLASDDKVVAGQTPPRAKGNTATIAAQKSPTPKSPTIEGTAPSPSGGSGHGSSHGSSHGGSASHIASGPMVDLLTENLLLGAPRTTYEGHACPALGGIPLLRKLGQGGMGAVYYGVHPRLSIEVAVKVLPYHLVEKDPLLVERFFREAQISAQVRSPHLVNVMDVNEESGVFFLVMEYVNGMSGKDRLAQAVRSGAVGLSEKETLLICIAATTGLDDAHARGIIHRDIKPENIMIPNVSKTSTDLDITAAKLMDLGLARAESGTINNPALTATKQAMGTPGYMAPEQIMDARTAGPRSDVFSMGATIYAMVSGQAPFKRKNSMQTLMATMNAPHVPLIEAVPGTSESLSHVVDICLAKDQNDRYPDGHTLLLELKECLARLGEGGDTALPAAQAPHLSEGQELPALVDAAAAPHVEQAAAPPHRTHPVLLYSSVAAVILLSIGVGVLWSSRGGDTPEKLASHKILRNGILREILQNDSASEMVPVMQRLKVTDPAARKFETAVVAMVNATEAMKREVVNFDEVNRFISLAEETMEGDPAVAIVRDRYHQKKRSVQDAATVNTELDAVESLVRAGDFAKAGEKLDATERKFSGNERAKRLRKDFDEKKTAYATARTNRIKDAENMLADPKSELADIDRKIHDLETLYASDPEVARLRTGLDGKKIATRKAAIESAEALLKTDLAGAERQVVLLEQKYPNDAEVRDVRQKLAARKDQEKENARLAAIQPLFKDFDEAFKLAEPDLVRARIALREAEKFASPAELVSRAAQLKEGTAKAERNLDFKDAGEAIANKVAAVDIAEGKLARLETKYANDPGLTALRSALAKRKSEVASAQETERLRQVNVPLSALDKLLADRSSDLKEAESKLADAQKAKASPDELAPYKRRLDEERVYRSDYSKAFGDIEKLFTDKAAASADLEKQFVALQAKYPGDSKLKDLGARVEERKQGEKLAAETARKKRVAPLIEAADTALAAASVDFGAVQKKLNEAESAGATSIELEPVQKKLGAAQKQYADRQRAFKSVEDAIADITDDAAPAEKKLVDFAKIHRGAPGLEALQTKLAEKKQAIVEANETKRKTEIKSLLDDVDKILASAKSVLADGRKKLNQAQSLGAATVDVESRRGRIVAEEERRYTTASIKQADDIVSDLSSDPSPADTILSSLEQKYPNNAAVKDARKRYNDRKKGHTAELEAAAKKRAENELRETLARFDGFTREARAAITAKDLARADLRIRDAERLFPGDPKLTALKAEYATATAAKKVADEAADAAVAFAAKKRADEDAKKKAADEEALRLAAKKKADDDAAAKLRAEADLATKQKAANDAEAARIAAAKKKADEVPAKKPNATPPTPEKKRRRIGEEDVE